MDATSCDNSISNLFLNRLHNAKLTSHLSIITLKENIQESELRIYKQTRKSIKSIISVSFHNKYVVCVIYISSQKLSDVSEQFSFTSKFLGLKIQKSTYLRKKN